MTEKIIQNLFVKIKSEIPVEVRLFDDTTEAKTVIFLVFDDEKDSAETMKNLENQTLN